MTDTEHTPGYAHALATITAHLEAEGNVGDAYPEEYAAHAIANDLDPQSVDDWAHLVPTVEPRQPFAYADGFGRWHALVPKRGGAERASSGGIITARRLIRDELVAREQKVGESITNVTARISAYVRANVTAIDNHPGTPTGMWEYVEYELGDGK